MNVLSVIVSVQLSHNLLESAIWVGPMCSFGWFGILASNSLVEISFWTSLAYFPHHPPDPGPHIVAHASLSIDRSQESEGTIVVHRCMRGEAGSLHALVVAWSFWLPYCWLTGNKCAFLFLLLWWAFVCCFTSRQDRLCSVFAWLTSVRCFERLSLYNVFPLGLDLSSCSFHSWYFWWICDWNSINSASPDAPKVSFWSAALAGDICIDPCHNFATC